MVVVIMIDIYQKHKIKIKYLKIGVGFSFQKEKNLPIKRYDKKLDCIITEKKLLNENIIFRRCCWSFRMFKNN